MTTQSIFAPLRSLLALLCLAAAVPATAQNDEGFSSRYRSFSGEPFFILADTQYGTQDEALLRFEAKRGGDSRWVQEGYGGVDIRLYRVPNALEFLQAQKNLHRVDVEARARDEGLANTLSYLWDNAWKKSRLAWRDLFSSEARTTVTDAAPKLSHQGMNQPTVYSRPTRFEPLKGFDLAAEFRYPIWEAKPIDPAAGNNAAQLAGSSSNFIAPREGNFYVPLGKLKPGLYIAEAIIGTYRAVTLVFVSDTVGVTKIAAGTLTVWAAHRENGQPVEGTRLLWTDGRGTLKSATTGANGLATMEHVSPERTYLLGEDPAGGVFVSENYYYDSEIHDTKLYAVTDRPLYRAGDWVNIKVIGREYRSAVASSPLEKGPLQIEVRDPNATPVLTETIQIASDSGADTAFRLPDSAVSGGYEIRLRHEDRYYTAAFRVAEYVKPHFEIEMIPDQKSFKTGEPVAGTVRLSYPDGQPVKAAAVELTLRAQTLTMVQGELHYSGLFPVELSTASLSTDDNGEARFTLPAAREPSRLVLTMLATDGAAYRVRSSRELLVERAAGSWKIVSDSNFSRVGDKIGLRLEAENDEAVPPATWEIIRLEDRTRTNGTFDKASREWWPELAQPGSYSLLLRDETGSIVGATSHWVSGEGLEVMPGTIEMVADKTAYRPGETAEVLVSFSEDVGEALLTLERDSVDAASLLSKPDTWLETAKVASNQWKVRIPVREAFAPNMTLSAVYVKNGDYVFQNVGLVVEPPRLAVDITPERKTYAPGETVTVDLQATLRGKPVQAVLTVSVVDEMIYVLQPEIAPSITDFFQHLRRNNVRTSASLNFIAYDEAADYAQMAATQAPARHQYNERGVKVLERARRDDVDTAAWEPALRTDVNGRARFTFRMPDALSRWRITVRAVAVGGADDGVPGQRTGYVNSDKDLYAKWTSPVWMREGDRPQAAVALFNNTDGERRAAVTLKLAETISTQEADLKRGVNYLRFDLPVFVGRQDATIEVRDRDALADALTTTLTGVSRQWSGPREKLLKIEQDGTVALDLPADARDVRIGLAAGGAEHFLRIADTLVDYPWGCTEQTASRLIPLALVAPMLSGDRAIQGRGGRLWQVLYTQRLRLAALAGPNAVFGWWGEDTRSSALMTGYAYYADWYASRVLGIDLPPQHWENLLEAYRLYGKDEPLLHRALVLWFAQDMGLPVRTQAEGLVADIEKAAVLPDDPYLYAETWSAFLGDPDSTLSRAHGYALAALVAKREKLTTGDAFSQRVAKAHDLLSISGRPSAHALLLLSGKWPKSVSSLILARTGRDVPTMDRALTLVWTRKALGEQKPGALAGKPAGGDWQAFKDDMARTGWRWTGAGLPEAVRFESLPNPSGATAVVRFDGADDPDAERLPVTIQRTLYRLTPGEAAENGMHYDRSEVAPGEELSTHALYLDEIVVASDQPYLYGLVEAALPPGATIERGTWGVNLGEEELERAIAEEHTRSYGIPLENVKGRVTVRHLLRLSQTGRFELPPTRYFRMYQPEEKALADDGKPAVWVVK